MKFSVSASSLLGVALALSAAQSQSFHGPEDPRVQIGITTPNPINGVATTPEGRLFVLYARVDGSKGPQVAEWDYSTNTSTAYPSAEWNNYTAGADPATHLVRTNSIRIGPDGLLWLVDTGSPAFGEPVILPQGPKLIGVNLTTNAVQKIYNMGNATLAVSLLDDVRFNPLSGKAYLTDAGAAGIIILDMASRGTVRVLANDPSTIAYMPVSAEGTLLHGSGWSWERIYADQHEVSPDGKYYYYQPANGGMSRIETKYLDQAYYNTTLAQVLSDFREPYSLTPSTGGTAIDADGVIYDADTDRQEIIAVHPNGTKTLLVQDPRLLWVDAMWIDAQHRLWMPAAQLNRGTPFNNGSSFVVPPLFVYTIDIGCGPPAIDHA